MGITFVIILSRYLVLSEFTNNYVSNSGYPTQYYCVHMTVLIQMNFYYYLNPELSGTNSDHPNNGGREIADARVQIMPNNTDAHSEPLMLA